MNIPIDAIKDNIAKTKKSFFKFFGKQKMDNPIRLMDFIYFPECWYSNISIKYRSLSGQNTWKELHDYLM